MAEYKGVLICGEFRGQEVSSVTSELIHVGGKLKGELGEPLSLLFVGRDASKAAEEAKSLGAEKVYVVDELPFDEALPERFVVVVAGVCEHIRPSIILFGQTDMGRDIAPRLGAKLDASVCLDCVELAVDLDSKSLLHTKPVFGGKAMAVWASPLERQSVVTVRPRASEQAEPNSSRKGEVIPLRPEIDEMKVKGELIETVREEERGVKLEEAKVVVAGGGGVGSAEGFKMLRELAYVLRGAVGISRVPGDEGWMPSSLEIGQTGHIVGPDLYIAVGISGAPQHLAGCSASKCIVAINKDPEAHIFKEADFGIVGDYREALPPLIDKLKELLAL